MEYKVRCFLANAMMWYVKFNFVLLCVLLFATVAAYPKCRNVRDADFKNWVYPLKSDDLTEDKMKWLRVSNGLYEDQTVPMRLSYLYLRIVDIAFGDLTGDGKEEAAVTAIYGSKSSTFHLTDTYIFGCVARKIKLIGILKQERIEIDSGMDLQESITNPLSIRNGVLFITHGTEGVRPSPEFTTTFRYKITRSRLVPYKQPLRRRND